MLGNLFMIRDGRLSYGPCDQSGTIIFQNDLNRPVNIIKRQNHSIAIELAIELPIDSGVDY